MGASRMRYPGEEGGGGGGEGAPPPAHRLRSEARPALGRARGRPTGILSGQSQESVSFTKLYDLIIVKTGSVSSSHWSKGHIRANGWLRACFPVSILILTLTTLVKIEGKKHYLGHSRILLGIALLRGCLLPPPGMAAATHSTTCWAQALAPLSLAVHSPSLFGRMVATGDGSARWHRLSLQWRRQLCWRCCVGALFVPGHGGRPGGCLWGLLRHPGGVVV